MGTLTLAVTGAGGFIGRHVVAAAAAAGHPVVAILRPGAQAPAGWPGAVAVRRADLTGPTAALAQAVAGANAVIHCAGLMAGDAATHAAVSVHGTRALCAALPAGAGLVVVSSIAVCGAGADADGALGAATPRADPATLAPYAAARVAQEEVAEAWAAAAPGRRLVLLRAGAVLGPGRLWNGHLGVALGPVVLRLGQRGAAVPVVQVARLAAAAVAAAGGRAQGVVVAVDDDLPDASAYLRALARGGWPRAVIPGHWRALVPLARLAGPLAGAAAPGLLRAPVLAARFAPRRYPAAAMRALLGTPSRPFAEAMARALAGQA